MIELRRFADLGMSRHSGHDAHHHFSFAAYHDPARTNWGRLRAWNDDAIAPGAGLAPHFHHDLEIVTYVRQGAIVHEDSLGNIGRVQAGDVQVLSAGSGIEHVEFNAQDEEAQIFQIWILPDARGGKPQWATRPFARSGREDRFVVLASGPAEDREGEALPIRADAQVLGASLRAGASLRHETAPERHVYLVPARGCIRVREVAPDSEAPARRSSVGEVEARERDGVAMTGLSSIDVTALEDAEIVLVDVT